MEATTTWAQSELGAADLGHASRARRAVRMLEAMAARPAGTLPAVFGGGAALHGAYRLLENPKLSWRDIAEAQHAACARRCRHHDVVIVPIDGTSLAHTDRKGDDGVGPIGVAKSLVRGLRLMTAIALSVDGVALGVAAHAIWARPPKPLTIPHALRALEQRESRHWTELQHDLERTFAAEGVRARPWYQMDREANATHVLLRALEPGTLLTVRANARRLLTPGPRGSHRRDLRSLDDALGETRPQAVLSLEVSRSRLRTSRIARMEVRFASVSVRLRRQWTRSRLGDVPLVAVRVREQETAPTGETPIEWLLLTTYPVRSAEDALRVVNAYALRWTTERVNYTWKTGACRVEDSQLESFESLARWATLQLSVAVHEQQILLLSRAQPELPATEVFDRDEIDAAVLLYRRTHRKAPSPGDTPTLAALVRLISVLGGFTASSQHQPGIKVFVRGFEQVRTAAAALAALREFQANPTPDDTPG